MSQLISSWRPALGAAVVLALAAGTPGTVSVGRADTDPAPSQRVRIAGERIYNDSCAICHAAEGEGTEQIPPLAGSEWVTGDSGRLIRIILHGVTGPMMVAGTEYSGLMPAFGGILDDAQIAAVGSYVRAAWGNAATPISAEVVSGIRADTEGRTGPWTERELTAIVSSVSHR